MWSVATRIVGKDHCPAAGITQTYEAREIPAKPWFRLFVERFRIASVFCSYVFVGQVEVAHGGRPGHCGRSGRVDSTN